VGSLESNCGFKKWINPLSTTAAYLEPRRRSAYFCELSFEVPDPSFFMTKYKIDKELHRCNKWLYVYCCVLCTHCTLLYTMYIVHAALRDMVTNRIFWCFCIHQFGIGPSHNLSSRSDFEFKFAEIFVIEKRIPASVSRNSTFFRFSVDFLNNG
jgi:hypothetical protein